MVDGGEGGPFVDEVELLRDVRVAEQQLAHDDVLPQGEAWEEVLSRLPDRSESEP